MILLFPIGFINFVCIVIHQMFDGEQAEETLTAVKGDDRIDDVSITVLLI